MKRALFLSDNEFINDLYTVNLATYVDTDLEVETEPNKVEERILTGSYDLLISLSMIGENDVGKSLLEVSTKKNIPLIIVGEKSEVSNTPDVVTVPGNLNIQFFLRSVAKILGVTAQDMANKEVGEFYPMALKVLIGLSKAPCHVYYKISKPGEAEEYSLVWSKGQAIDKKFDKFKDLKIFSLYIPSSERLSITNLVTTAISQKVRDKNLSQGDRLEAVESGFELMAQSLFSTEEISEEVLEISNQCVEAIGEVLEVDSTLGELLQSMLNNKSRFIYMHSVLTTYVCHFLLKKIAWGSKEHIEKVSYVLFFHDMFLVPVYNDHADIKYEEDLIFSPDLNDAEKDIIINHAKEAGNALKSLPKSPIGADTITTQHHGATNGIGFAMDPGDDVSPLAKVILIGEAFVDEFLKAKDDGREPHCKKIVEDLLERYTNKSYQKMSKLLESIKL
ncbi:MAG: HD-GYP domain-containing protein (c-di-GMP phosphodiesterase class II) [Bacteriovoracaceae bacterium]|jgi:HD-GYP domain-containing protein (c-di-GMP phosphodiesterase class II)